jgi:hypothetical protein
MRRARRTPSARCWSTAPRRTAWTTAATRRPTRPAATTTWTRSARWPRPGPTWRKPARTNCPRGCPTSPTPSVPSTRPGCAPTRGTRRWPSTCRGSTTSRPQYAPPPAPARARPTAPARPRGRTWTRRSASTRAARVRCTARAKRAFWTLCRYPYPLYLIFSFSLPPRRTTHPSCASTLPPVCLW